MGCAPTADVDPTATVHPTARVWDLAQVREGAVIEEAVVLGRGAYIGAGVHVARNCKIQNYALVYEPAYLGEGVFIGPAAVLTNDLRPRAVRPDGSQKTGADWNAVGVTVHEGASIGARAVCVAPVSIGRWSMVAAGAVVTRDVPDFALVAGVPARRIGWVGRTGRQLVMDETDDRVFRCPETGADFMLEGPDRLVER